MRRILPGYDSSYLRDMGPDPLTSAIQNALASGSQIYDARKQQQRDNAERKARADERAARAYDLNPSRSFTE